MQRETWFANSCPSDHELSDHKEDAASSGASTPRGENPASQFGSISPVFHGEKSPGKGAGCTEEEDGKSGIHKIISSKAEAWIAKKGKSWPWKGNDREAPRSIKPLVGADLEDPPDQQKGTDSNQKSDPHSGELNRPVHYEASGSWSSPNMNSTSSVSSSGSTNSSTLHKADVDSDCLDYEILWEDLTIGEQIGQGSLSSINNSIRILYDSCFRLKIWCLN